MSMQEDFESLIEKLKTERDELKLKLHLGSMEAKDEFEKAEEKWDDIKSKAKEIADDTKETSDEFIAKAKIVGEEVKEAYRRISERLSD
ncbi:hypothetical protein FLL45_21305 [Aliikangiella marina]|uniref:Coiled coil domain-containing protein n=1 Tax=Aliikangiella marina TaxID=1712262 RepID=A0A545T378_9GAMM|nr:hypothetical protein [Aliikangiella marina]TQV71673.1 hypothetical protein FLL45_21225 [Aliikangiella marina]TQV71688.1 hypothetical protein FLL45_21305 [Aliikangiella marina]